MESELPLTPDQTAGDSKASPLMPPPPPFNTPCGNNGSTKINSAGESTSVGSDSLAGKLAGLSMEDAPAREATEGKGTVQVSPAAAGMSETGDEEDGDELDEGDEEDGDEVDLPPEVMKRLYQLKSLQSEKDVVYSQYKDERAELESKFAKLYGAIYGRRTDIVTGRAGPTTEGAQAEDAGKGGEEGEKGDKGKESGVPHFWMQCMLHHEALRDVVCEGDLEALYYLSDVRCVDKENLLGFTLEFHFDDNPFFTNAVLTKRYDTANIMDQGEPLLEGVDGTKIEWKKGRNLCEKVSRKRSKRPGRAGGEERVITKVEKTDSFFKFFLDPMMYDDEDEDEDDEDQYNFSFDMDYEVARIFRNHLIPNAVLWFTGEAVSYEDEDDEEEEETDGLSDEDGRGHDGEEDDDGGKKTKFTLNFSAPAGFDDAPRGAAAGTEDKEEGKHS